MTQGPSRHALDPCCWVVFRVHGYLLSLSRGARRICAFLWACRSFASIPVKEQAGNVMLCKACDCVSAHHTLCLGCEVIIFAFCMIVDNCQADSHLLGDTQSDCLLDDAEGYSTSYMDPYGAMRTSNPMYRDPEESERPALPRLHCLSLLRSRTRRQQTKLSSVYGMQGGIRWHSGD